jgi:hypothetical protein
MVTARWADAVLSLTGGEVDASLPLRSNLMVPVNPVAAARLGVHYLVTDTTRSDAATAATGWTGPVVTDGVLAVWENPEFVGEAVIADPDGDRTPRRAAEVVDRRDGYVRVVVRDGQAEEKATVRIDEQFTPDWHVTVDGQAAKPLVVDGLYIGTAVGPGSHVIVFRYQPRSFKIGVVLAVATFVAGAGVLAVGERRRRKSPAH